MTTYKDKLKNDFNDFEEIISNDNHIIRVLFRMYLNGDYGRDISEKWFSRWKEASTEKKSRSIIIQAFGEYNATDYDCSYQQQQKWLVNNIGHEKLEQLNKVLMSDFDDVMEGIA